jgi:hypothetical protein
MSRAVSADRVAIVSLALLGGIGPVLAERGARLLDPELCVALAWERAGAGELVVYQADAGPVRVEGRLVSDPWGFPLRREVDPPGTPGPGPTPPATVTRWVFRCIELMAYARSYGPDGEPSADDVVVKDAADWPEWQRLAAASPWGVTLVAAIYVALAWPILRSRPRTGLVDLGIAALVVLPLAPVAFTLGATELMARWTTALPVMIPASFAVPTSVWLLALLLAFAVRVSPRPEAPTWPVTGDTIGP